MFAEVERNEDWRKKKIRGAKPTNKFDAAVKRTRFMIPSIRESSANFACFFIGLACQAHQAVF